MKRLRILVCLFAVLALLVAACGGAVAPSDGGDMADVLVKNVPPDVELDPIAMRILVRNRHMRIGDGRLFQIDLDRMRPL